MSCTLYDRQHRDSCAYAGLMVESGEMLQTILEGLDGDEAFMVELISPNGERLLLGVGAMESFVQHSAAEGRPPYRCAVAEAVTRSSVLDFLIGDTPTPMPARFCIPVQTAIEIAKEFCRSGKLLDTLMWEEV